LHYACEVEKKIKKKKDEDGKKNLEDDDEVLEKEESNLESSISTSPSSKKALRKQKGKELRYKERQELKESRTNDVECSFSVDSPFPDWIKPDFEKCEGEIKHMVRKLIDQ
jgi:hypothetical protein